MNKLDEATISLTAANTKLAALDTQGRKVVAEITVMSQTISDLTAIIDAGGAGDTTPEFDAAITTLQTNMDTLSATMQLADDANPDDAPVPVPPA